MALHFDIMVNREPIGRVIIQRRHELTPDRRVYWYDVDCEYPWGQRTRVAVQHHYEDGAVALIVEALSEVLRETAGPRPY